MDACHDHSCVGTINHKSMMPLWFVRACWKENMQDISWLTGSDIFSFRSLSQNAQLLLDETSASFHLDMVGIDRVKPDFSEEPLGCTNGDRWYSMLTGTVLHGWSMPSSWNRTRKMMSIGYVVTIRSNARLARLTLCSQSHSRNIFRNPLILLSSSVCISGRARSFDLSRSQPRRPPC